MSPDFNNDKLTAYALDELNSQERLEVEKLLEENPSLKEEVESIKAFSLMMKAELQDEKLPALEETFKKKIFKKSKGLGLFSDFSFWKFAFPIGAVSVVPLLAVLGLIFFKEEPVLTTSQTLTAEDVQEHLEKDEPLADMAELEEDMAMHVAFKDTRKVTKKIAKVKGGLFKGMAGTDTSYAGIGSSGNFHKVYTGLAPVQAGESYNQVVENIFKSPLKFPLSTFSVDVDTASYSNMRRYILREGKLPPKDSIRTEEFINYFEYDDPAPTGVHPFSVHLEVTDSPWNKEHQLVRVALKAKALSGAKKNKNLVFLVDASGSMEDSDKMPLLKEGFHRLVDQLTENDRVSIVIYAGNSGVHLEPTRGDQKKKLHDAIDSMSSYGSTNGAAGIKEAYRMAKKHFIKGGVNRVILATDGDFNVGTSSQDELKKLIKKKAKTGVFLTVLGFGTGNLQDGMMEEISNKGNGNYYYIDSEREARKVLVKGLSGTLETVAKDVKIQVEFNPAYVEQYRLIGYENRLMKAEDFSNDKKDAGEIGAGHSVVALYEIIPPGVTVNQKLKYQKNKVQPKIVPESKELLTVKLRYKKPNEDKSILFEQTLAASSKKVFSEASSNIKWVASVAAFSKLLKESKHNEDMSFDKILEMSKGLETQVSEDRTYREEFLDMVRKARRIKSVD